MKKTFLSLVLYLLVVAPCTASSITLILDAKVQHVILTFQIVDPTRANVGFPRTPVHVPNVYLDQAEGVLYFENPCYDCTLELYVPGSDAVVYSVVIPDGDDTVQFPTELSGEYELHLHRGNYCFYGEIEL